MYYVYVLENQSDKSWYIGFTSDVDTRLKYHNEGKGGKTTAQKLYNIDKNSQNEVKGKWKRIYCEIYLNKKDALGREKFLKSGSGRRFLKKQFKHYLEEQE